jgi:hypothetical protein
VISHPDLPLSARTTQREIALPHVTRSGASSSTSPAPEDFTPRNTTAKEEENIAKNGYQTTLLFD